MVRPRYRTYAALSFAGFLAFFVYFGITPNSVFVGTCYAIGSGVISSRLARR